MKKLYFILICFSICFNGLPQSCLPLGIIFDTQIQIDNFQLDYPGCTEIEGDVTLRGSDIFNLIGLNSVTVIRGDLNIYTEGNLTDLTGLENIKYIGGNLRIGQWQYSGNPILASLESLNNLTTIGGDLTIYRNVVLTSLTGLDNVTSIGGYLTIQENSSLSSLTALDGLDSIGGSLTIWDNDSLTSLSGLDGLTYIGGHDLRICYNDALTSLNGLEGLNEIESSIEIRDNTNLASLSGLNNLNSIGGSIEITRNKSLTSLIALEGLTSMVGFYIIDNAALTDLTGLEGLAFLIELWIWDNQSLSSLTGLNGLTTIDGALWIKGNNSLVNLTGLEKLTYVDWNLLISENSSLTSLAGFDNLDSIGQGLLIHKNNALTDLTNLHNLSYIGLTLAIDSNDVLEDLDGLANIKSYPIQHLYIIDNYELSSCAVKSVCDCLANGSAEIEIHDNAIGCSDKAEVKEDCINGLDDSDLSENLFNISPNPSSTRITIETPVTHSKFPARTTNAVQSGRQLSIFNLNGQEVIQRQITDPRMVIDISDLPGGIYFVRITGESAVGIQKFIKID